MNKNKIVTGILTVFILIICSTSLTFAQDTTQSLAFKSNKQDPQLRLFYRPDLSYQIWQHFKLIQSANSGDPLAEHELGLRYLLGEGFAADTVQAAFWIKKAADTHLAAACYNYGILLNNGWGVKWNPFEAFKYFMIAAKDGMPQAEQVVGLIYTDNLIVKRNWNEAYKWLKKAADDKYKPAQEILTEFKKKIKISTLDTASSNQDNSKQLNNSINNSLTSSLGLVYIDFHTKTDSMTNVSNKMLLEDLLHNGNDSLAAAIGLDNKIDTTFNFNSKSIKLLEQFADAGSPEALTLIGKFYEKGIHYTKNDITASVFYIRAIRLDSPRAPQLLWKLIQKKGYYSNLKNLVDKKNPQAMFTWYGLYMFGFDNSFTGKDAFNLLVQSAQKNFLPAVNELGLSYYTGKLVNKDKAKAISIWEKAENLGSEEAKIRLATADILDKADSANEVKAIKTLKNAVLQGSVLAQAIIAYCYESGIIFEQSIPNAVEYYRYAAQRGSQYAYAQLKRLYDDIRPDSPKFELN